jgi:hypothetical protein
MQHVPSLAAVTYGNLIFLGLASLLAWIVGRRRVPAPYAVGFTVFVAVTVASVRPLGFLPWITTYAMLYNRYGWVLYATLLLLVFIRPDSQDSRHVAADGLVLGLLLGLLFYCKINFFLVGIGAVGVGLILSTLARRLTLALSGFAGFLAIAVTMRLGFGIRTFDYLRDVAAVAPHAREGLRLFSLARSVIYNLPVMLIALLVIGGLLVSAHRRGEAAYRLLPLSTAAAYVIGSSILVSATNSGEKYELPALTVVPLLLVTYHRLRPNQMTRRSLIGLMALLLATSGPIVARDALGLSNAVALRGTVSHPPASQQISSDHLRDFVIPTDSAWQTAYRTANVVPNMLNDGMAVLRRHIAPKDTVFTMALTNPFSFALSLPPGHGTPLWWDLGYDFDATFRPNFSALDDVPWVMIPRTTPGQGVGQETVQAMLDLYDPYLAQHFTEAERTSDWILLARKRGNRG